MENLHEKFKDLMQQFNWENAPLSYEWSNDIESNISYTMEGHSRLKTALNKMGYKASIGIR